MSKNVLNFDQKRTIKGVNQLLDYFSGGPKPLSLGLRKLQGNFWEIRTTLDKRVLFLLEKDIVSFVIVGNHDEIRRYLRKASLTKRSSLPFPKDSSYLSRAYIKVA